MTVILDCEVERREKEREGRETELRTLIREWLCKTPQVDRDLAPYVVHGEYKRARKEELEKLSKEWLKNLRNLSEAERGLFKTINDYDEKYFGDFTFKSDSIVAPFLEYRIDEDGEEVTRFLEFPEYESITSLNYRFLVKDLEEGTEGTADHNIGVITIPPHNLTNKNVILHEMTHAYEDSLPWPHREILLTCLYGDLSKKIPDLDEHIIGKCHSILAQEITLTGGSHSILFRLKCLDLDLRCELELGTIFGYDLWEKVQ